MYRCVAFDMDGTLLDTMPFWRRSAPELARERGVILPESVCEQVANRSVPSALALLRALYPAELSELTEAHVADYMERQYRAGAVLKPGVAAYVARLRAAGYPLCVLSATPTRLVELALTKVGIRDAFDFILTTDEHPAGKETPAIFEDAARRFGVAVNELALVDDALYSLETAAALGVYCIGVADAAQTVRAERIRSVCAEYYAEELGVK